MLGAVRRRVLPGSDQRPGASAEGEGGFPGDEGADGEGGVGGRQMERT